MIRAAATPRSHTAPSGPAAANAVTATPVPNWMLVEDSSTRACGRSMATGSAGVQLGPDRPGRPLDDLGSAGQGHPQVPLAVPGPGPPDGSSWHRVDAASQQPTP